MKILVLNGSPRLNGNTAAMVEAFVKGAELNSHDVTVVSVCSKHISGCKACEYCHTKGDRKCIQQDDMQEIYPVLDEAEMIVLASPVYYHGFTGQLQCAVNRIYALDKPKHQLEDMGIFTAFDKQNKSDEKLDELMQFGKSL